MSSYIDYGPVRFRFESSQRKNDVVLYDSELYRGKTSEWFLTRKNKQNETYRCVHCRCLAEKNRRSKAELDNAKKAGARITVKNGRFTTDPDFPLGSHICNFENNPKCDIAVVWGRRALLRANTELRKAPERPKIKFEKLIHSIKAEHLDNETRQRVVDVIVNSKNGFDSRRRSFARNNSIALRKDIACTSDKSETKKAIIKPQIRNQKSVSSISQNQVTNNFSCGIPACKVFQHKIALRNHKRNSYLINNFFEPKKCSTDNHMCKIKEPQSLGKQVPINKNPIENEATIIAHDESVTIDIEGLDVLGEHANNDLYTHAITPSSDHFIGSVNSMLDQIYEYTILFSHNPHSRDIIFSRLNETLQLCSLLCQQEGYMLEVSDEFSHQEMPIIP